jgi:hypothetical protein
VQVVSHLERSPAITTALRNRERHILLRCTRATRLSGGPAGAVGFDRAVRQTTATDARQRGFRYTDDGDGDGLLRWRVLFRKYNVSSAADPRVTWFPGTVLMRDTGSDRTMRADMPRRKLWNSAQCSDEYE